MYLIVADSRLTSSPIKD